MCDAFSAAMILGVTSTGLQTVGAFMGQKAENKALTYQAAISQMNASEAIRQGRMAESRHRTRTRQLAGKQIAGYAGANVLVSQGSPALAVSDTRQFGEMDAMEIQYQAAKDAWMHTMTAEQYRKQRVNPWLVAGTTLLGGSSQLTGMYAMGKSSAKPRIA